MQDINNTSICYVSQTLVSDFLHASLLSLTKTQKNLIDAINLVTAREQNAILLTADNNFRRADDAQIISQQN